MKQLTKDALAIVLGFLVAVTVAGTPAVKAFIRQVQLSPPFCINAIDANGNPAQIYSDVSHITAPSTTPPLDVPGLLGLLASSGRFTIAPTAGAIFTIAQPATPTTPMFYEGGLYTVSTGAPSTRIKLVSGDTATCTGNVHELTTPILFYAQVPTPIGPPTTITPGQTVCLVADVSTTIAGGSTVLGAKTGG